MTKQIKYKIPKDKGTVRETATLYRTSRVAPRSRYRRLRSGESAFYPESGHESGHLSGPGVDVYVEDDGSLSVCGPKLATLDRIFDFVFACLIFRRGLVYSPTDIQLIRISVKLTQQQFADRVGVARETINAYEKLREPINAVITGKIQHTFLSEGFRALSRIADQFKNLDVRKFDKLQEELEKKAREGFKAARGVKLVIH